MKWFHGFAALGVLVLAIGIMMIKQKVEDQEKQFRTITRQIFMTEEELHLLKAESAYLSDLTRIGRLARQELGLIPGEPKYYVEKPLLAKQVPKNWHSSCNLKGQNEILRLRIIRWRV